MRQLIFAGDPNSRHTFAPITSDTINSVSLAGGVAESMSVPSGANFVIFSSTTDFYANYTTTATVPGDITNGTASELNPTARYLKDVTTISIIAPQAGVVTMAFYA